MFSGSDLLLLVYEGHTLQTVGTLLQKLINANIMLTNSFWCYIISIEKGKTSNGYAKNDSEK